MFENKKILLTQDRDTETNKLSEIFSSMGMKVRCCARNGAELLGLASEFEPDVIIMDAFMQHIDGMGVLARLNHMNPINRPLITVLSCVENDNFQKMFLKEGADYCFIKPVDENMIAERILQMLSWKPVMIPSDFNSFQDLDVAVGEVLHRMGIPSKVKGYRYLREAICLVVDNPDMINKVTTVLYPTVAKTFNSTSVLVERTMRYAIKVAWDRGNVLVIESYFGSMEKAKKRPTNSEFIARISDDLRYRRKMKMKLYEAFGYAENI